MSTGDKVLYSVFAVWTIAMLVALGTVTISNIIENKREKTCEHAGYANHVKIDDVRYCYRYNEGQIELLKFELAERYNND